VTQREWMLAGLLAVAGALVTRGLFVLAEALGWIGAGVLVAVWCWFVLAEDTAREIVSLGGDAEP
jgi:hypothetical protein